MNGRLKSWNDPCKTGGGMAVSAERRGSASAFSTNSHQRFTHALLFLRGQRKEAHPAPPDSPREVIRLWLGLVGLSPSRQGSPQRAANCVVGIIGGSAENLRTGTRFAPPLPLPMNRPQFGVPASAGRPGSWPVSRSKGTRGFPSTGCRFLLPHPLRSRGRDLCGGGKRSARTHGSAPKSRGAAFISWRGSKPSKPAIRPLTAQGRGIAHIALVEINIFLGQVAGVHHGAGFADVEMDMEIEFLGGGRLA